MKTKFLFIVAFVVLALTNSCKKTNWDTATASSQKSMTCIINDNKFTADSVSCWVDTVNHTFRFTGISAVASIFIKANYTLVDFNIPLVKDTFGSGTAVTYFNSQTYGITNGNMALKVNGDNTVSGTFFYRDNANIIVSEGMYSKIPITYY